MPTKERDVVLTGKENGVETIDLPITRLGNIEDGADTKTSLVDNDAVPVMDSADGNEMKKITWANVKAALKTWLDTLYNKVIVNNTLTSSSTTEALSAAQGKALKAAVDGKEGLINTATDKSTLVDSDTMPLSDSAASNATKKITFANFKAALKAVFDALYVPVTRKINGKALSADVTLTAADVGAAFLGSISSVVGSEVKAEISGFTAANLVAGTRIIVTNLIDIPANATLNINSLGAKLISWNSYQIKAGGIPRYSSAELYYTGGGWILMASDDKRFFDAILAEGSAVVTGKYAGTGAKSIQIHLPFTPSAVLVVGMKGTSIGQTSTGRYESAFALKDTPADLILGGTNGYLLSIDTNMFTCWHQGTTPFIALNNNGTVYFYAAFRF